MIKKIRAARARGVPLMAVRTADQPDCMRRIASGINGNSPVWSWDCVRGIVPMNDLAEGSQWPEEDSSIFVDPMLALIAANSMPEGGVLIALGGDRFMEVPQPSTAALLLRDVYASSQRTLIALGSLFSFASELGSDVLVLDDPLPNEDARRQMATDLMLSNIEKPPTDKQIEACVRYTRGLSGFACQQTLALAMIRDGINIDVLSDVWREAINAVNGLRVLRNLPTEADIAGLDGARAFMRMLADGREPPEVIVFADEIEKMLGGAMGDTSGTSQAILGMMLSHMEDTKSDGKISAGPPGTGKSHLAKIAGGILGIPVVQFDHGALKNSLVGETEANARRAFATLAGLGGRQFWFATTNNAGAIPAELQRRFTSGIWMYDLPSKEERLAIWAVHMKAYGLTDEKPYADDNGWTGADIRNVCRLAWRTKRSLQMVAKEYVPSSRASAEMIETIRRAAAGTYFSASYAGAYRLPRGENEALKGRKMALGA